MSSLVAVSMTASVIGFIAAASPASSADGEVTITEAPALTWGFKKSWRLYAGEPAVSDGAAIVNQPAGQYDLEWDFDSGSYDPGTRTTVLKYTGSVHWQKYPLSSGVVSPPPGYTGPMDINVLDVTLTDPVITISADGASIRADAISRMQSTMELTEYTNAEIVSLDVSEVTPTVVGGTTTWADIPGALGDDGKPAFGNAYSNGTALDDVSFSYTGPGDAPDFSENWAEPDSTRLDLVKNEILTTNGINNAITLLWQDTAQGVAHYRAAGDTPGTETVFAVDLDSMEPIGEPLTLPAGDPAIPSQILFYDTAKGRLYHSQTNETRWISFDRGTGKYTTGLRSTAFPLASGYNIAWDAKNNRALTIARTRAAGVGARDYDQHVWKLFTYAESPTEDGLWERKEYVLPSFPTGLNQIGYANQTTRDEQSIASLEDGSLIVIGREQVSSNPAVPAPTSSPGAYRIQFTDGDNVQVDPVPGMTIDTSKHFYEHILEGADGQINFVAKQNGSPARVQALGLSADGESVVVKEPVEVPDLDLIFLSHTGIDPEDGTVWLGGYLNQRLVGVRDGRIVANQFFKERHPRGGPIFVGPDHTVYAQTNDGSPPNVGGSPIYGIGKFESLGFSPTVNSSPHSTSVELDVDEESEPVELTSTATGSPAPARQWQVKQRGASTFTNLDGQTAETLTVNAIRGSNGSQYRAVYSNTAGRIASDVATLTATYAPRVIVDPSDASQAEGEDATFLVMPAGDPEPSITWQRRVSGFWQDIADDDNNFTLDGGTLTIKDTNVDQSGSLVRAKLTNSVATVYTRSAKLTVVEPSDAKRDISAGGLDWGVKESFRTYVTGNIAHGEITVSDGATKNDDGTFRFEVEDGTYDPKSKTITVDFAGMVRFTGHDSGSGPVLDMRIADPELRITGDTGVLVADVSSKNEESGHLVEYADVEVATVDTTTGVTVAADQIKATNIAAELTTAGAPAFGGFYQPGVAMDPLNASLQLGGEVTTPVDAGSTATLKLGHTSYTYGSYTTALVKVSAAATTPTGKVTVRAGAKTINGALKNGSVRVGLPKGLKPGRYPVTVSYAGATGIKASTGTATFTVTKATPKISAKLARSRVKKSQRAKIRITVTIPGGSRVRPTGQLVIRDGGKIIQISTMKTGHKGRITITLPRLKKGKHYLRATISGSSLQSSRTTTYKTLTVR